VCVELSASPMLRQEDAWESLRVEVEGDVKMACARLHGGGGTKVSRGDRNIIPLSQTLLGAEALRVSERGPGRDTRGCC